VTCPKCKADQARRSHRRGWWEHLIGLLAIHPYRCRACEIRFLKFRWSESTPSVPPSGAEREVSATRRSIKWRRKRRELLLYGTGFALFLIFLYYISRQREGGGESTEP